MKSRLLATLIIGICLLSAGFASAKVVVINTTDMVGGVVSGSDGTTHWDWPSWIGKGNWGIEIDGYWGYQKYTLPSDLIGSNINAAYFQIYPTVLFEDSTNLTFYRATGAGANNSVTYNTRPTSSSNISVSYVVNLTNDYSWNNLSILNDVQYWANGNVNYGWLIKTNDTYRDGIQLGLTGYRERLYIDYTPLIIVNQPTNNQIFTQDAPTAIFQIQNETAFDTCRWSIDSGATNYSMTYTNSQWSSMNTTMTEGNQNVVFYCNKSADGSWLSSSPVSFTVNSLICNVPDYFTVWDSRGVPNPATLGTEPSFFPFFNISNVTQKKSTSMTFRGDLRLDNVHGSYATGSTLNSLSSPFIYNSTDIFESYFGSAYTGTMPNHDVMASINISYYATSGSNKSSQLCLGVDPATEFKYVTYYNATIYFQPNLTIVQPTTGIHINQSQVTFNISSNNAPGNLSWCGVSLNSQANMSLTLNATRTGAGITNSSIADGQYNFTIFCNTTSNILSSVNSTFIIDVTYPQIQFTAPTAPSSSNLSQNYIWKNLSIIELNMVNITYTTANSTYVWQSTTSFNNPVDATEYTYNGPMITDLNDGTYTYNVTVCDKANNCNTTETRTITLDTTLPTATLNAPANNTHQPTDTNNYTANLTDNLGIQNATLYIYNSTGLVNQTTVSYAPNILTSTIGIVVTLVDNLYTWFYKIFDWAGNSAVSQNFTSNVDAGNLSFCHPINSAGTYYLNQDIVGTGDCFDIRANNVIFDCNSWSITGPGGATSSNAIYTNGYSNITIQNCNIRDFSKQVSLVSSDNSKILNTQLKNSVVSNYYGAYLDNSDNLIINNLTISENSASVFNGIYLANVDNAQLSNVTIKSNTGSTRNGIYSTNSPYTQLTNSNITGNIQDIRTSSSHGYYTHSALGNINVVGTSNNTLLNTSETSVTVSGAGTNQLIKQWYFNLNVTGASGNMIDLAQIDYYNNQSSNVFSGTTFLGNAPEKILNEYTYTNSVKTNETPHNITAQKPTTYLANSTLVTINQNKKINLILPLADTSAPTVTIIYPTNANYSSMTEINYSASDSSGLSRCWYSLNGVNSSTNACLNFTGVSPTLGTNTLIVYANDTLGNLGSASVTFRFDNINPNGTLISPANATYKNNSQQNFTVNVSDNLGLKNVTLNIYNSTGGVYNQTSVILSGLQQTIGIIVNLVDGIYNWFYSIFDSAGNNYITNNNTVTIDTASPQIQFVSPTPLNNSINNTDIIINVTAIDTNLVDHTIILYDINMNLVGAFPETTAINTVLLSAANATYYYKATATDLAGNTNSTELRKIIFDMYGPTITIVTPQPIAYGNNTVAFNYTVSDLYSTLSSCWYRNDTDATNILITCGTNTTISNTDGTHTLYVWANDSLGNVGSTNVTYSISTGAPSVVLNNPIHNIYLNSASVLFNFTATKTDLDTCELFLDGLLNQSVAGVSGVETNFNTLTLANGIHTWNVRCNDSLNNAAFAFSNFTLTVDTILPQINYASNNPQAGVNLSQNYIFINTTVTEINFKNITFYIYNSTHSLNYSLTPFDTVTRHLNTSGLITLSNGIYYYNVTICDLANNCNSTATRQITLDNTLPTATQNSPDNNTYSSNPNQNFSVNLTDNLGIKNSTIHIDGASSWCYQETANSAVAAYGNCALSSLGNYSLSSFWDSGGTSTYDGNWGTGDSASELKVATVTITYMKPALATNNSLWQVKFASNFTNLTLPSSCWNYYSDKVILRMVSQEPVGSSHVACYNGDYLQLTPSIIGILPTVYEEAMIWEFNYTEQNDNYSPDTTTGSSSILLTLADGIYSWFAKVFDWAGNLFNSGNRILTVDTIKPAITINTPQNTTYTTTNILLNVSTSDTNLQSLKYSLNGASNITFTNPQNVSFSGGTNVLTVYANDSAGNENSSTVTFYVIYTNLLTVTSQVNQSAELGGNVSIIATTTTDNTQVTECNFTVNGVYTNQKGTKNGVNWTSPSIYLNRTGIFNYNVTCINEFNANSTISSSFTVSPYNLTISQPATNYSFAARVYRNETNNISMELYDNSRYDVNYSVLVSIDNPSNFTLTYANSVMFDSSDAYNNTKKLPIQVQADPNINESSYNGNVTLTNLITNEKTYLYFTYGIKPPSGIPKLYRYSSGVYYECSSSNSDACKMTPGSMTQGASTNYIFYAVDLGNYSVGMSGCSIKFTDTSASGLANNNWITSSISSFALSPSIGFKQITLTINPKITTTPQTYSGHAYIHCNSGDALNSPIDSDSGNAPYIELQVLSYTGGGGGGGGGGPFVPVNISNVTQCFKGNGICEDGLNGRANCGETYQNTPDDCEGNLNPITDCGEALFGGDKGECILFKGTAFVWIIGFMTLVFLFLIIAQKRKSSSKSTNLFNPVVNRGRF